MDKGKAESSSKKKHHHILVETWKDLPSETRKSVVKAGITPEEAVAHLKILLSILRFKTHTEFYFKPEYESKPKVKPRRHNVGQSLVSPEIVSTLPIEQEEAQLLSTEFGRKHYKTSHQIGKGGYGRVFLSKSQADNKTNVAIKRVPYGTPKERRKGHQEIRLLKYCTGHPNIVGFKRAHLINDELWMVMEYLEGSTLMQAVQLHRFSEPEVAYTARYILKAIQFLHNNQIAHRDLKSSNIMLTTTGKVKPFWMAPEMIRKEPHGLAVDIWSFAICILELANGRLPHRKSSMLAMFRSATEGIPSPLESSKRWSSQFSDFLSYCLSLDPSKRATVEELLAHPWLEKRARRSEMKPLFSTLYSTVSIASTT